MTYAAGTAGLTVDGQTAHVMLMSAGLAERIDFGVFGATAGSDDLFFDDVLLEH